MEKVKRKKNEKEKETLKVDLRAEGVKDSGGARVKEKFFFSKIELMSDMWQREKKNL